MGSPNASFQLQDPEVQRASQRQQAMHSLVVWAVLVLARSNLKWGRQTRQSMVACAEQVRHSTLPMVLATLCWAVKEVLRRLAGEFGSIRSEKHSVE